MIAGAIACTAVISCSIGMFVAWLVTRNHYDTEIDYIRRGRIELDHRAALLDARRDQINRGVTLGTPAAPESPSLDELPPRGHGVRIEDDDALTTPASGGHAGGGRHRVPDADGTARRSPRAAPAPPSLLTATLDVALAELAQIRAQHRWVSEFDFPAALRGERVVRAWARPTRAAFGV